MSRDQFAWAENEFFTLKGQLEVGRITPDQFEAAVKQLMVQDPQGRYWVLGPNNGQWYVHDGQAWVPASRPVHQVGSSPVMTIPRPPVWAIALAGVVVIFVCLLLGAALVVLERTRAPAVALAPAPPAALLTIAPQITDTVVPTTAFVSAPTVAAPATATLAPSPVAASPAAVPTMTLEPATLVPPPTPTATLSVPTPTLASSPTVTLALPSPTVAVAPGVYVVGLRVEPPFPRRGQPIAFYVRFLNTTGGDAYYRWLVFIFRASNLNSSFGETTVLPGTIPAGETDQKSVDNWRVTGLTTCENYVARVMWTPDNNRTRLPFIKPDRSVPDFSFQVCP